MSVLLGGSSRGLLKSVTGLLLIAALVLAAQPKALASDPVGDRPDIQCFNAIERADLFAKMSDYITSSIILEHLEAAPGPSLDTKHGTSRFTVWHRNYIKGMEDYLISQDRAEFVPLPRWSPATSIPAEFLLDGGVDADCPTNVHISHSCDPLDDPNPNVILPEDLSTLLCNQLLYPDFRFTLEAVYHGTVHVKIGGAMGAFKSPAAPIFWLWHAYVDDVWFDWQCLCGLDEVGAFDDYSPAEKNTDLEAGIADAWMQDSALDIANEPNNETAVPWETKDIWIRNSPATPVVFSSACGTGPGPRFLNEHDDEDPIYQAVPYIYVKVRNRGCMPVSGQLHVYWAAATVGGLWPDNFNEVATSPMTLVNIGAGRDNVAEFHWTDIPMPTPTTGDHFCLAARFVASPASADPIIGEGTGVWIGSNVKNSNQIVSRNVTIVNDSSFRGVIVRNISQTGLVSLHFDVPSEESGDSYFDHGPIKIDLGFELFNRWLSNGALGSSIGMGAGAHEVLILADGATIEGLSMTLGEEFLVNMQFGPLTPGATPCEDDRTVFDVRVSSYEGPNLMGGNTYEVHAEALLPSAQVVIDTLDPQINCVGGSVTLFVTSGLPDAGTTLQWFVDDVSIPGAMSTVYAATQSGRYTLLMTYPNGCDRLSQPVDVYIGTPPANDDPCAATTVALDLPVEYDIYCATGQPGEATPGSGSDPIGGCYSEDGWCANDAAVQNSVWYRFTAPASGTVSIHADMSHMVDHRNLTNTQLAVWQAGDCADYGTYSLIAANDNSGDHGAWGTAPALHDLTGLLPGGDYYIQIDGYLGGGGKGMLLVETGVSPSFCDGTDGSLAACPCANPGTPDSGCDNAQGTGGVRIDVVAQSTSPNGATLTGIGFSTMGAPVALVLRSNALDPASPIVFGDGLRCISTSPLVRLAAAAAAGGVSTHTFGHSAMAGAGTFYYQLWYRNTPAAFCTPSGFNLSNGTRLIW